MDERYLIYGRNSCRFCILACDFLNASKKEYLFFDYDRDRTFLDEVKEFYLFPTVPIILENDTITGAVKFIGGYSDLLDHAQGG